VGGGWESCFCVAPRFQLYLVASLCGATLTSAALGTLIGGGLQGCNPEWNSGGRCWRCRRSSNAFFLCSFSCSASFFLWRRCSCSAILWSFFCSFFSLQFFLFQRRCFCRCFSDFSGCHLLRCRLFFRASCERDLFAMMPEFEQLVPMQPHSSNAGGCKINDTWIFLHCPSPCWASSF
jgi:hypothetical protein